MSRNPFLNPLPGDVVRVYDRQLEVLQTLTMGVGNKGILVSVTYRDAQQPGRRFTVCLAVWQRLEPEGEIVKLAGEPLTTPAT